MHISSDGNMLGLYLVKLRFKVSSRIAIFNACCDRMKFCEEEFINFSKLTTISTLSFLAVFSKLF